MVRTTTIRIKETTKKRMDSIPLGKSTYDTIINRALDYFIDKVSVNIGGKK